MLLKRIFPITNITLICTLLAFGSQNHTHAMDGGQYSLPNKYPLLNISDTEYKLALAQALFEICPSMLTVKQQAQFNAAYQNQIRLFMPNASDPKEAMQKLASKQDYQVALKSLKNWTASFPPSENKALCQEFAQSSIIF
ncbi:MCR_0457 family protein [Moraxella sp. VT-16-12]|uniref:MCR_0457 family protein n=1 Tax=Moraxella sp. VT-16-12 TaxID=2014877 RepID=UPI000B7D34AD|nr:hypothetical protein [Moraxella sp. VT-16-12]TWV84052.1 hypothetical protein CEW93_002670 [Moraxella sp. VT-16-12]